MTWNAGLFRRELVVPPKPLLNVVRLFPYEHVKPDDPNQGALGFKRTPSRFTDNKDPPDFGVVYLAESTREAIHEVLVRDQRVDWSYRVTMRDLDERCLAFISSEPLILARLSPATAAAIRLHRDYQSSSHKHTQALSAAIHRLLPEVDGIHYPSTFTGGGCIAVYERSLSKLRCENAFRASLSQNLIHGLAQIGLWAGY